MSNLDVYDIQIDKLKSKRKYALIKLKVANTVSIGFYTLGLAAVVVLSRKYCLEQNIDLGQYLKETLSVSCACSIGGALTKNIAKSSKDEIETYDDEYKELEESKKK
nr:hypothetical protein [Bacilli bacterium]